MKNKEESVVKNEGDKKMKLQKKNPFVKFKTKPLVITIALAGMILAGGIGSLKFVNTDKFDVNLSDYDKAITMNVDVKKYGADEVNIDYATLSSYMDTAYNITTTDDWDIYVGPNNATLIDIDPEGKDPKMSKLDPYDKALVNYIGELEELDINAASIGLLQDHPVYIQSYDGKRQLVSANNTVVFREISERDLKKFDNPDNFDKLYIDLYSELLEFDYFEGERDLVVNDITLKSLAIKWRDGKYYEYIAMPEQCIYEGRTNNPEENLKGQISMYTSAILLLGNDKISQPAIKNAKIYNAANTFETPFVYIIGEDGRKVKVAVSNTILVTESKLSASCNEEPSKEFIIGTRDNRQILPFRGVGLAYDYNHKAYATESEDDKFEYIIGFDYGIPVVSIPESEFSSYTWFDERTTCTIKTLGLEEVFEAEGYKVTNTPSTSEYQFFKVLRKVGDKYFQYYLPKGSFMFNSRELDIGRQYQKTK